MVPGPDPLPYLTKAHLLLVEQLGDQPCLLEAPNSGELGGIDDHRIIRLTLDDEGDNTVLAARCAFQVAARTVNRYGHTGKDK